MSWQLSPEARHASDHAGIGYDGGGPWSPAAEPAPVWHLGKLVTMIRGRFPWARDIGTTRHDQGVVSRTRGRERSLHAVGRAADVMVPRQSLAGPEGTSLANWLVENAQALGVQLVIWDHSVWQGSSRPERRFTPYSGPNPHVDHVHVELTAAPGPVFAHEALYLLGPTPRYVARDAGGQESESNALAVLIVVAIVAASVRKGGRGPGFWRLLGGAL